MKPAELFPGAVVMRNGKPYEVFVPSYDGYVMQESGSMNHAVRITELSPLPLSLAVLDALDVHVFGSYSEYQSSLYEGDVFVIKDRNQNVWYLRGVHCVQYAHQLQTLILHLYGVELFWNQAGYELWNQAGNEEALKGGPHETM